MIIDYYTTYLKIRFHFRNAGFNYYKDGIRGIIQRYRKEKEYAKAIIKEAYNNYSKDEFKLRCLIAAIFSNNFYITDIKKKEYIIKYNELVNYFKNSIYFLNKDIAGLLKEPLTIDYLNALYNENKIHFINYIILLDMFGYVDCITDNKMKIKIKKTIIFLENMIDYKKILKGVKNEYNNS